MSNIYAFPVIKPERFTPTEAAAFTLSAAAMVLGGVTLATPTFETHQQTQHELRLDIGSASMEANNTITWYARQGGEGAVIMLEGLGLAAIASGVRNRRLTAEES